MKMANSTPFGLTLSFQREAARMGQRTVEQGIDAQRTMTEAFVRNAVGMGRITNRNATEVSRQNAVGVAGMVDAMMPLGGSVHRSVDAGFDSITNAQENAWRAVEESAEDGLEAYAQLAEGGKTMVAESVDATLEAQEEAGRQVADAAVEYERQRPEDHATERTPDSDAAERAAEAEPREIEMEETGEEAPETAGADAEPATEPEGEAEMGEPTAGVEEPTEGPALVDLSGVGTAYADRLRAAGIESVEQLLDAEVTALSGETEISDERLANWQRQARHMLGEDE